MSRNKYICVAVALVVALVFAGCASQPEEERDTTVQINPVAPEAVSKDMASARLYFGYAGERLLVGETRTFETPINESVEISILDQLIKGPSNSPSAAREDFKQLIHPDTKVYSVEAQGQYLFVTLSSEFLLPLEEVNEHDDEMVSNEKTRRFLAVYSIVNTLVEQGTYSRVTILIDEDGIGRRLTQSEAGLDGGENPTDSFERKGDIVLNSRNTLREILVAIEKKEWSVLYNYIAYQTASGQDKPSLDEFVNEVVAAKLSVSNYQVVDSVVSPDGLSEVVMADYDLKLMDGEARLLTNIPVRLTQENDVWKISYNVFKTKFLT